MNLSVPQSSPRNLAQLLPLEVWLVSYSKCHSRTKRDPTICLLLLCDHHLLQCLSHVRWSLPLRPGLRGMSLPPRRLCRGRASVTCRRICPQKHLLPACLRWPYMLGFRGISLTSTTLTRLWCGMPYMNNFSLFSCQTATVIVTHSTPRLFFASICKLYGGRYRTWGFPPCILRGMMRLIRCYTLWRLL